MSESLPPLRLGLCTTDNRDHWRKYDLPDPIFGPAIAAVLQGLAEFPKEIEVHVISVTQKPLASPARLAPNIFYHSLVVPKIGWLRTGYQGCIRAVRGKVRTLMLDLVHGQGTERDCAMEAVFSGRPNLITIHGNMRSVARALRAPLFSYHWFHSFLEALTLRRTHLIFCNSSYTEGLVRPINQNVLRIPNAARKAFFSPTFYTSPPAETPLRFLVIGLICSYKQPLEILRMLKMWRAHSAPPFRCQWIGNLSSKDNYGRMFSEELASAKDAGWAEHRDALGEEDLKSIMDNSDILIHIPKEEAFGLVVIEAMLRGMRIVAGRVGGVADFAGIYPAIRFVDPESPQEWMQALSVFANTPRSRVPRDSWDSSRFHPKEVARKHLLAYRSLVCVKT
jgi:glycosyltransferase involved in cell wall biosynthesis